MGIRCRPRYGCRRGASHWNRNVGEYNGRCRQVKHVALSAAGGDDAHLAFGFERSKGEIECVELNRISLHRDFRRDCRGLFVQCALGLHWIRPPSRAQCIDRSEIAGQRERDLVDLAPKLGLDRRIATACVYGKVVDDHACRLTAHAVDIHHCPIINGEVADAERARGSRGCHRCGRSGRCRRRRAKVPVRASLRVGLESDHRISQRELHHLEAPRQERQQRDLHVDTFRSDHVGYLASSRVAERYVGKNDLRFERQLEIDRAVDGKIASGGRLDARLYGTDQRVKINGRDRDRGRNQYQRDDAAGCGQNDERGATHPAILPPRLAVRRINAVTRLGRRARRCRGRDRRPTARSAAYRRFRARRACRRCRDARRAIP